MKRLKNSIVISALILLTSNISAQYYNHWPMGYSWSEDLLFGLSGLDFNQDSVQIVPKRPTQHGMGYNGSFICNGQGNLKLMTNGCAIIDHSAQIILNGDSITSGLFSRVNCPKQYPALNSTLMLPDFNSDEHSIIITKEQDLISSIGVISDRLYYNVVFSDSFGDHSFKDRRLEIRNERASYDQLAPIPHADGRHWWVVEHRWNDSNTFLFYKMSKDTAYLHSRQSVGPEIADLDVDGVNMVFSPDGTKLAMLNRTLGLLIYDFDRATGELSNYRSYYEPWMSRNDSVYLDHVCFSPDSKLIYVTASVDLYQIDEEDIMNPIQHIIHMPRLFDDTGWPTQIGDMHIGPDCRIYVSPRSTSNYLHVIHHPNIKGPDCGVEFKAIRMPVLIFHATPRVSFYHLGTGTELCDSTIAWISQPTVTHDLQVFPLSVYPNPTATEEFNVELDRTFKGVLEVCDEAGRQVLQRPWYGQKSRVQMNGQKGLHFVRIHNGTEVYIGKVMLK